MTQAKAKKHSAKLYAFTDIVAPLLASASKDNFRPDIFIKQLEQIIELSDLSAKRIADVPDVDNDYKRWHLAKTYSQLVAKAYDSGIITLSDLHKGNVIEIVDLAVKIAGQKIYVPTVENDEFTIYQNIFSNIYQLVNSLANYNFEMKMDVLVTEIFAHLEKSSETVLAVLEYQDIAELKPLVIKTLVDILVPIYEAESAKLKGLTPAAKANYFANFKDKKHLTNVWKDFDLRLAILTEVAKNIKIV